MKQRGEKRIKTNSNHVNGSIDDQKMLVKNTGDHVNTFTDNWEIIIKKPDSSMHELTKGRPIWTEHLGRQVNEFHECRIVKGCDRFLEI